MTAPTRHDLSMDEATIVADELRRQAAALTAIADSLPAREPYGYTAGAAYAFRNSAEHLERRAVYVVELAVIYRDVCARDAR